MKPTTLSVFQRCGLAALSDLASPEHGDIFANLELEQTAFLDMEAEFRSKEYKWPRDPLHDWARVWEYPYVYYHLAAYMETLPQDYKPVVADVGSGVTFFPFSIAKLGYQVICTDIDPICERDLSLARECVPHSPGTVDFGLAEGPAIPFGAEECDAVYCISVLEHVPDFEMMLVEITRILKPGGLFILTCDINLRPEDGLELGPSAYQRLMNYVRKVYNPLWPECTVHPADLLTTRNGPYPLAGSNYGLLRMGRSFISQKILKPLLGRKPGKIRPDSSHVAVLGLALIRRK